MSSYNSKHQHEEEASHHPHHHLSQIMSQEKLLTLFRIRGENRVEKESLLSWRKWFQCLWVSDWGGVTGNSNLEYQKLSSNEKNDNVTLLNVCYERCDSEGHVSSFKKGLSRTQDTIEQQTRGSSSPSQGMKGKCRTDTRTGTLGAYWLTEKTGLDYWLFYHCVWGNCVSDERYLKYFSCDVVLLPVRDVSIWRSKSNQRKVTKRNKKNENETKLKGIFIVDFCRVVSSLSSYIWKEVTEEKNSKSKSNHHRSEGR